VSYDQTRAHHALILSAYVGNLPPIVLDQIIKASRASWAEALNGNRNSQLEAQAKEREVIRAAIDTITDHGIRSIENTIEGGRA
jgi:hypothetical protein